MFDKLDTRTSAKEATKRKGKGQDSPDWLVGFRHNRESSIVNHECCDSVMNIFGFFVLEQQDKAK